MKQEEVRTNFNNFLSKYELSVSKVSKDTGLEYSNLSKFKSGIRPYSFERLVKISNYMDNYTSKVDRKDIPDTKKAEILVNYLDSYLLGDSEEVKIPILKALREIEQKERREERRSVQWRETM